MLTLNNLNINLLAAEYAVRGPIVTRAQQLEEQGRRIIYCNVGNPQALKQKALTYLRQILSFLEYPIVLENPGATKFYHKDVIEKVRHILARHPHGTGAYSQSAGIPFIRQAVADFIQQRDNIPADKEHIILTDGASKGVQAVLLSLLRNPSDGFLIPVPQYPLYSATINLYGGKYVGYYLDEKNHWQLSLQALKDCVQKAQRERFNLTAIAVINPGNPTGAVLSYDNIKMVIEFAKENNLAILADEVYQENVYAVGKKFYSFAKVMNDINEKNVSLFSFHSVSKGFLGECGHRGGYAEFRNIPDDVMAEMVKLQSISLCANVVGQIATYVMVSPPKACDESYETYVYERDSILNALKRKAEILGEEISKINGMHLETPEGAMYAFVRIELPPDPAIDLLAMSHDQRTEYESKRDFDYCMTLLERTGICVVPGSGFGQIPGTLHFRTTFLPPEDEIKEFVVKLKEFHTTYVKELTESYNLVHS